jgi:hypothetical protein
VIQTKFRRKIPAAQNSPAQKSSAQNSLGAKISGAKFFGAKFPAQNAYSHFFHVKILCKFKKEIRRFNSREVLLFWCILN